MTYFQDMGTVTLVAAGPHIRAVGWLDSEHAFAQGDLAAGFAEKLREFVDDWSRSARLLGFHFFAGDHQCEFCGNAHGGGDFGVPSGALLFVAPVLILHYVCDHRYLPPPEFVDAVLKSPPPRTWRYRRLVRRFQGVPMSVEDEQRVADALRAWVFKARPGPKQSLTEP